MSSFFDLLSYRPYKSVRLLWSTKVVLLSFWIAVDMVMKLLRIGFCLYYLLCRQSLRLRNNVGHIVLYALIFHCTK